MLRPCSPRLRHERVSEASGAIAAALSLALGILDRVVADLGPARAFGS
jgi:hypothetical protein